jgi:predicted molibdopterin-dependent oxidoreductase YjgC
MSAEATAGRIVRLLPRTAERVTIRVHGEAIEAFAGESLLVAMLARRNALRTLEFGEEPSAGFCLMGACQDCWVHIAGSGGARACTAQVADGMRAFTELPQDG